MTTPQSTPRVHRWKTMSPNLSEHPDYPYIEVVRASDYDSSREELARCQQIAIKQVAEIANELTASRAICEKLAGFVQHPMDCGFTDHGERNEDDCTCGLTEIIAAYRAGALADEEGRSE